MTNNDKDVFYQELRENLKNQREQIAITDLKRMMWNYMENE